jgi:hypothetical protein
MTLKKLILMVSNHLASVTLLICLFTTFSVESQPAAENQLKVKGEITVTKIWDKGPHNAFTDIIHYNGELYITFREAGAHVPKQSRDDGKIRVLRSPDGDEWESFALLELEGYDLRDPKLSITPQGKLMLLFGGSVYQEGKLIRKLNHFSLLDETTSTFSTPEPIKYSPEIDSDHNWLWTITWHNNLAYGVIYRSGEVFLVKSEDGLSYSLITQFDIDHFPNEAKVEFLPDDEMMIVMRRDGQKLKPQERIGLLGKSMPPYSDWKWTDMNIRLGGPHVIQLPNGQWLLGTRAFDNGVSTSLFLMNENGNTEKLVDLPSGGDTSYPGMVICNNKLWVSYYSSHEGKANIYIAQIPMEMVESEF